MIGRESASYTGSLGEGDKSLGTRLGTLVGSVSLNSWDLGATEGCNGGKE